MRNIWFTADSHYDHANVIRFDRKRWLQDGDEVEDDDGQLGWVSREVADARVKAMNEDLIAWHNELVKPGDEVWHLGDIVLARRNEKERIEYFVRRLNGQYNWVFGNHDHRKSRKAEGFNVKTFYHELRKVGPEKDAMICLFHYAARTWNKRHHGSIFLHGHSHGSLPEDPYALSYDVGVDCHDYRPVHIDTVLEYMAKKKEAIEAAGTGWKGSDHHSSSGRD